MGYYNYNELKLTIGTYVLMQDVDRYNDVDYETRDDAEDAMLELEDEGIDGLWVGRVEEINEQPEIMFVCGTSA